MELRELRSFVAVARELHFGRASAKLHLSQPALSAQIRSLEESVGATLLDRNRRRTRLTPAGEAFLADAERLLLNVEEARQRAQRIAGGEAGHLRLGFVASAALTLVPSVLLAFRREFPQVTFDIINLRTVEQIERLRERALDAGFVRLPLAIEGLHVRRVHAEPFVLAMPPTHPLARRKQLALSELATEPFVAYGRRWAPGFFDTWIAVCTRAGFSPRIVQETAEMDTLLTLVSAGAGLAIVPEGLARRRARELVVRSLPVDAPVSEIGLATGQSADNRLVRNLLRLAIATGRSQGKNPRRNQISYR